MLFNGRMWAKQFKTCVISHHSKVAKLLLLKFSFQFSFFFVFPSLFLRQKFVSTSDVYPFFGSFKNEKRSWRIQQPILSLFCYLQDVLVFFFFLFFFLNSNFCGRNLSTFADKMSHLVGFLKPFHAHVDSCCCLKLLWVQNICGKIDKFVDLSAWNFAWNFPELNRAKALRFMIWSQFDCRFEWSGI